MTRCAVAVTLVLLSGAATGRAQQAPPRDARRPTPGSHSISGRVFAADGKTPLHRAVVTIASPDLPKTLSTRTDELGRYRFAALPASGSFTLTASKTQYLRLEYGQRRPFEPGRTVALSGESLTNVDFRLPRAAVISGSVLDTSGEPLEQMWVMAFRRAFVDGRQRLTPVRQTVTNDIGQYRLAGLAPGDYYVVGRDRAAVPTEFSRERVGFAVTYFPGATSVQEAQPVRLALGQHATAVDLVVASSRAATISGQVVRVDGSPVPKARLMLQDHAESGAGGNIGGGATADEQGRFRIAGVPAGEYYLAANATGARGAMTLTVSGADVPGVTLLVGSGGTLAARIVSSTGDPLPFPPGRVELSARLLADPYVFSGVMRPTVKPDWTVEWTGVTGPRVIRATRLPAGWWMKAVLRGDREVTDDVIEIAHGQAIKDLVVVLDDKPTDVIGTVRDSRGAPAADYTVIAFSPDSRRWTPESRFVRAARPDHTGVVRISGLPPGEYLVAAVEYVEQGQWLDPSYLESLRPRAQKMALGAARAVDVELTLILTPSSASTRGSRRSISSCPSCRAAVPSPRRPTAG